MIQIETKHYLNDDATRVAKTVKTWKVFGITVIKKSFYYPEKNEFSIAVI